MGSYQKLTDPITNTSAPLLPEIDPIESAGSLLLVDLTHPSNPLASGVPASGAVLPNLLWQKAAAVTGAGGVQSDYGLAWTVGNAWASAPTSGKLERTGKGGIHAILSQGSSQSTNTAVGAIKDNLKSYIRANPLHSYYFSLWMRETRKRSGTLESVPIVHYQFQRNNGGTGSYLAVEEAGLAGTPGVIRGGYTGRASPAALGPALVNEVTPGWPTGEVPAANVNFDGYPFLFGRAGLYNAFGSNNPQRLPSHIVYRCYLEDLTVSGRSYAAVDAIDNAMATKLMLTTGGRYFNDTFTDPATIA